MSIIQSILLVTLDHETSLQSHFNIDLTQNNLDTLIIQSEKSIGIDEIKDAKRFAIHPPSISSIKKIIIPEANRLTLEAQNALLKLLEEPPKYLQIILAIKNPHQLLETIISRCRLIIDHHQKPFALTEDVLISLLAQSPKDRLNSIPPLTTKEAALIFCNQLIESANRHLHQNPSTSSSQNFIILLDCQTHLTQNTNPTLTVTNALLSLLPP